MGRRAPDGFRVGEDWHGHTIMVDGKGVFYVTDDDGKRTYEAKSIDTLKSKINKQIKVNIRALIEGGYGYRGEDRMQEIAVYAFTGIGAILFTRKDGAKEKATRWQKLWVYDEERLKKRRHFLAQKTLAERNLEKLMEGWPRVTPPNDQDTKDAEALQDWGAGKHLEEQHPEPESEQ